MSAGAAATTQGKLTTEALQTIHENFRRKTGLVLEAFQSLASQPRQFALVGAFYGVFDLTDAMEANIFESYPASNPQYRTEYEEFINLDAIVFPLEFLSSLNEKDPHPPGAYQPPFKRVRILARQRSSRQISRQTPKSLQWIPEEILAFK